MKHQSVMLTKDVKTNFTSTFPEVFEKGTLGEKVLIVDKERGLVLVEIKIKNKVYLYTFDQESILEVSKDH